MQTHLGSRAASRIVWLLAALPVCAIATGCNPASSAVQLGVKVVGDVVNDVDASQKSEELIGGSLTSADAAFGERLRTFQEMESRRLLILYPVKDDVLHMFRWAVESENDEIVALSKLQNDPDGGSDIAEKAVLDAAVKGKSAEDIASNEWFQNLVLTLRDVSNGNMVRVYDASIIPNLLGAKYCVLEFDSSDTCQHVRIVGASGSSGSGALSE